MACAFYAGDREKDYAAATEVTSSSSSSSSCNPSSKGPSDGVAEGVAEEMEDELELGLSLWSKKKKAIGGRVEAAGKDCCRILTAEDLPTVGLRVTSPLSSSSSSSVPMMGRDRASGVAFKRAARGGSNGVAGSANSPSQMVVGWPPIRTYRINSLASQSKDTALVAVEISDHMKTQDARNLKVERNFSSQDIDKKARIPGKSSFVKVNMDGDPIGRKVDISAHVSYETLTLSLEGMFCKLRSFLGIPAGGQRTSKLLDGSFGFTLTYKDKDGDWMLVGDVPWGMFLNTVKRLRIMRTCDTNGLDKTSVTSSD